MGTEVENRTGGVVNMDEKDVGDVTDAEFTRVESRLAAGTGGGGAARLARLFEHAGSQTGPVWRARSMSPPRPKPSSAPGNHVRRGQ
jgi:hypothetical protein